MVVEVVAVAIAVAAVVIVQVTILQQRQQYTRQTNSQHIRPKHQNNIAFNVNTTVLHCAVRSIVSLVWSQLNWYQLVDAPGGTE
jgi:hypothetical protein